MIQTDIDGSLRENTQQLISQRIKELMNGTLSERTILDEPHHLAPNQIEIALQSALKEMTETADVNQSLESENNNGFANQAKQYVRKLIRPMFMFQTSHNRAAADLAAQTINLIKYNERQQTNLYLRSVRHFEEKLDVLLSSIQWLEQELQSRDNLITELQARVQTLELQNSTATADNNK